LSDGYTRAGQDSGGTNQVLDHSEQVLQIEGLEEVAIPAPDGVLRLGPLQVPLRGGDQDDRDLPRGSLLPQLSEQVPPCLLAVTQVHHQQRGASGLDLVEGARDEVGRGDVVLLVLQQLAHHVEELDRAVNDEDVFPFHLFRRRSCSAVHAPVPTAHPILRSQPACCAHHRAFAWFQVPGSKKSQGYETGSYNAPAR